MFFTHEHMRACLVAVLLFAAVSDVMGAGVKMKISKRYLNFPISQGVECKSMTLSVKGEESCRVNIRLTAGCPDYWTFRDVSQWRGKTLTISFDGSEAALSRVFQADTIVGGSIMYHEPERPQYHFSTRRGWINDPNGLVYHDGLYHLFYQHNPYEREWGNMHWGHAVSRDLLHWQELPLALHPDSLGTMFSGSAVIDYDNTAGFNGKDGRPALIAIYTANGQWERQCLTYSLDNGMTFRKYVGNPVIDSHERWQSHDTRDPKVFWYAPAHHWVMVLYERSGHSIYTSTDLKHWQWRSHVDGFYECPDLFELPVDDGSGECRWVMWGASGTYMIGKFDGQVFAPDGPKQRNMTGTGYAAQTYNNLPARDGRTIKMTWANLTFGNAPFKGVMLLPQEQVLHRTATGLRLLSRPIRETEHLFTTVYKADNLTQNAANSALQAYNGNETLRIRAVLELTEATAASLSYRGQPLFDYNMSTNLLHGAFYVSEQPGSMTISADIYVDRGVVEVFVDGGAFSYAMKRGDKSDSTNGYIFTGNQLRIHHLEVAIASSIWDDDANR